MNKSIHTEYTNLTPYQIKYLDGCGATWCNTRHTFSNFSPFENWNVVFDYDKEFSQISPSSTDNDYTHLPTGDAFCQGVAEILGIEYVPEGTKMETVTEDKGLAIDVKLLSEEDREWLIGNVGGASITFHEIEGAPFDPKYIVYTNPNYYPFPQVAFSKLADLKGYGLTITTDPNEFMRYVANKTGKEWEPKNDKLMNDSDVQAIIDLIGTPPTYPHKAYRVLDSLDGVPFDKRIPLSQWVPPFGVEVLFIFKEKSMFSSIMYIGKNSFAFDNNMIGSNWKHLDGHWMRII